jgi:hypothetical protein
MGINVDELLDFEEGFCPCYVLYPGYSKPQPGFIQLDANGVVTAKYEESETGEPPEEVRNRVVVRIDVNPLVTGGALSRIAAEPEFVALLERIHAGHKIAKNGVGSLSRDARKALGEIKTYIDGYFDKGRKSDDFAWLAENLFKRGTTSFEEVWPKDKDLDDAIKALTDAHAYVGSLSDFLRDEALRRIDGEKDKYDSRIDISVIGDVHLDELLGENLILESTANAFREELVRIQLFGNADLDTVWPKHETLDEAEERLTAEREYISDVPKCLLKEAKQAFDDEEPYYIGENHLQALMEAKMITKGQAAAFRKLAAKVAKEDEERDRKRLKEIAEERSPWR